MLVVGWDVVMFHLVEFSWWYGGRTVLLVPSHAGSLFSFFFLSGEILLLFIFSFTG